METSGADSYVRRVRTIRTHIEDQCVTYEDIRETQEYDVQLVFLQEVFIMTVLVMFCI